MPKRPAELPKTKGPHQHVKLVKCENGDIRIEFGRMLEEQMHVLRLISEIKDIIVSNVVDGGCVSAEKFRERVGKPGICS